MYALTRHSKVYQVSGKIYEPDYCKEVRGLKAYKDNESGIFVFLEDTVKIAESLEDLVQTYIVVKGEDRIVYKVRDFTKFSHKRLCLDIKNNIKQCYGAIWERGILKPIARMNDEGELELYGIYDRN